MWYLTFAPNFTIFSSASDCIRRSMVIRWELARQTVSYFTKLRLEVIHALMFCLRSVLVISSNYRRKPVMSNLSDPTTRHPYYLFYSAMPSIEGYHRMSHAVALRRNLRLNQSRSNYRWVPLSCVPQSCRKDATAARVKSHRKSS